MHILTSVFSVNDLQAPIHSLTYLTGTPPILFIYNPQEIGELGDKPRYFLCNPATINAGLDAVGHGLEYHEVLAIEELK